MSGKAIEVTPTMKRLVRELRMEAERQGCDYFQATWASRLSDADGDGRAGIAVSAPGFPPGEGFAHWKEGGDA